MCGIIGYVGTRPAVDVLLQGLQRLEYRGYDSAGVAFFRDGKLEIRKSEGKLANVRALLERESAAIAGARCGIGHTRWATHGKPTTQNAHPHRTGHVVLVHNGIIENYQEIRRELVARGHAPQSETDSELFGFLVLEQMDAGHDLVESVRRAFTRLHGQCSVVVMSEREPGRVVGARNGSPLVAAVDPKGGAMLASDAQPILEYAREVHFLENGDLVVATERGLEFRDLATGRPVHRAAERLDWSPERMDKQGYAHFMLKEIMEQPTALIDTLNGALDRGKPGAFPFADHPGVRLLAEAKELVLVACGTSWHAALTGQYWLEQLGRVPVRVELASEYRYREPVLPEGTVVVGITQSGETADTLAVLRDVRRRGRRTLGITNVRGSSVSREADAVFYTSAGPEIGVAATKTFLAQLLMLLMWAGARADAARGTDPAIRALFDDLIRLPHLLKDALAEDGDLVRAARATAGAVHGRKGFFFIGRGTAYPLALEGALKLKEIAYLHAEGYAAGELKHGPIAMIDESMAVVVIAPRDRWRDKTVSNLEEVKARGARIVGIGAADDAGLRSLCDHWIPAPTGAGEGRELSEPLLPFVLAPALQLFSYELALLEGTDVDKPRNLAKSVTVE